MFTCGTCWLWFYFLLEFSANNLALSVPLTVPQSQVPSGHFEICFYRNLTFPAGAEERIKWLGWLFVFLIWSCEEKETWAVVAGVGVGRGSWFVLFQ